MLAAVMSRYWLLELTCYMAEQVDTLDTQRLSSSRIGHRFKAKMVAVAALSLVRTKAQIKTVLARLSPLSLPFNPQPCSP